MRKRGYLLVVLAFFLISSSHPGWGDTPIYDNTPEGTWLRLGESSLFFQGFSPYPFILNVALLGGITYLSGIPAGTYKALPGRLATLFAPESLDLIGKATGFSLGVWYTSTIIEQQEWVSGQARTRVAEIVLPGVTPRLVLMVSHGRGDTVVSLVRNPLIEPVPLSSATDTVSRNLLSIHKEMYSRSVGRLELIPYQDKRGAGLRVGWRENSQDWRWLNLSTRFSAGPESRWFELTREASSGITVSVLQPEVLEVVLKVLKTGRSTSLSRDIAVAELVVDRTEGGFWSATVNNDEEPVVLEGVSKGGVIERLKLFRPGYQDDNPEGLYRISRSWTAFGQLIVNLSWLLINNRPDLGIERRVWWENIQGRLSTLKSGKFLGAGMAAAVSREIKGEPRLNLKVVRDTSLSNQNRIDFSSKLYEDLSKTVDMPWIFELTGKEGRTAWVANSQRSWKDTDHGDDAVYMSDHVMNRLQVKEGDRIPLLPVKLQNVKKISLEILKGSYIDYHQFKGVMEDAIDARYPTLHQGEIIRLTHDNSDYSFRVKELSPPGADYTVFTRPGLEVDYPDMWPAHLRWDSFLFTDQAVNLHRGERLDGHRSEPVSKAELEASRNESDKQSAAVEKGIMPGKKTTARVKAFSGEGRVLGGSKKEKRPDILVK
ncbi:hypothetical protein [Parendozoicomonas sp. Alg238-R29]|uniref:hypothetical protein n=1 Tax=Parendozoicomonas sp. Alg238-R29 TaxID=2993446 RepID=UPI00248E4098|nr:hypothetical protein [Parendozoicomonas sp. Alg238-R29]